MSQKNEKVEVVEIAVTPEGKSIAVEKFGGSETVWKKSDKVALGIALFTGIVALVLGMINYFENACDSRVPGAIRIEESGKAGMGGGRRATVEDPDRYIQFYNRRIELLGQLAAAREQQVKAGAASTDTFYAARLEYDLARLGLQRLKNGRRPSGGFGEALLRERYANVLVQQDAANKSAPADEMLGREIALNTAQLNMLEAARRMKTEDVEAALKHVREYPARELSEGGIEFLVSIEPARGR